MSLTSYRAAPPRVTMRNLAQQALPQKQTAACAACYCRLPTQPYSKSRSLYAFCRPGSDLLSRVLRRSTISAGAFHGRVRNGIGCSHPAITTRSAKRIQFEKLISARPHFCGRTQAMRTSQVDRVISTGKLHALPHFHTRPINVVVYHDSQGILVFRSVSRLDAFSGYPFRI